MLYHMGELDIKSDDFIWFYRSHVFEEDVVVNISLTEYILGREYASTFYYEQAVPEFKTYNFLFSK